MEVIFLPEARDAVMGQRGVKKRKNDSESNWRLFFSFFLFFFCLFGDATRNLAQWTRDWEDTAGRPVNAK